MQEGPSVDLLASVSEYQRILAGLCCFPSSVPAQWMGAGDRVGRGTLMDLVHWESHSSHSLWYPAPLLGGKVKFPMDEWGKDCPPHTHAYNSSVPATISGEDYLGGL